MAPIIAIFGTSHTGKSTFAAALATHLGWPVTATDTLARHPGRPWLDIPPAVAEHYQELSDDTVLWFLRVHHANIWPQIQHLLRDAAEDPSGAIFEGSALRPEYLAALDIEYLLPIGLHADEAMLRQRILANNDYANRPAATQALIDKFLTRTLRENADFTEKAEHFGLPLLDVGDAAAMEKFTQNLLDRLRSGT